MAQICLAARAMRPFLKKDLHLEEVKRVKFLNPAMPDLQLCLDLELQIQEKGFYAVAVRISGGEKIISKMDLLYRERC